MDDQIFDAEKAIQELIKEADAKGVQSSSLDGTVNQICDELAFGINNGGLSEQIAFIITNYGPSAVQTIQDIFNEETES